MAQIFVAEVIDDGPAYGTDLQGRLNSIASTFTGNGTPPVGTIEWRSGGGSAEGAVTGFSAPLFPYLQQIPLVGEFVLCIGVPMPTGDGPTSAQAYFYLGPVMIDGSRNRNIAGGVFQRGATPIPFVPSPVPPIFPYKAIPKLAPLVGDTIIEDRHGSSIRMSATQMATAYLTSGVSKQNAFPWTLPGIPPNPMSPPFVVPKTAGNPLMVVSVGNLGKPGVAAFQKAAGSPATLIESIGLDTSTMYLTSDQNLNYFIPFPKIAKPTTIFSVDNIIELKFRNSFTPTRVDTRPNDGTVQSGPKNTVNGKVIGDAVDETVPLVKNPHGNKKFVSGPAYPLPTSAIGAAASSQIFMRSHRIVLDAALDSVLISADRDVKFSTANWRMEVDSTMTLLNEMFNQMILLSMHCQELTDIVSEHMKITTEMQFPTGVGPTGPTLEFYRKQIDTLRSELGAHSATAKAPLPDPGYQEKTTYTRFRERQEHLRTLYREFSIQRRSMKDKQEKEKQKKG